MGKFSTSELEAFIKYIAFVFMVSMIGLSIFGSIRHYDEIPQWDMWDATVNFNFIMDANFDFQSIFSQHNEHRLILSRLFYYFDYHLLQGSTAFLIATNYFIIISSIVVFYMFLGQLHQNLTRDKKFSLVYLCGALLFFWAQHENITWKLQVAWFMAYSIPLFSFYLLAKFAHTGEKYCFIAALGCGILSAGTMANGVIALPFMFVYSIFFCKSKRYSLILGLFAAVVVYGYLYNYVSPGGHGDPIETITTRPLDVVKYVLVYLGAPWGLLFQKYIPALPVAYFAAIMMISLQVFIIIKKWSSRKEYPFVFALILFILFVEACGFITASGRVIFGLGQAFSYRYTTGPIMVACAMLILAGTVFSVKSNGRKMLVLVVLSIFSIFTLMKQYSYTVETGTEYLSNRKLGALSLVLGINDLPYTGVLFPSVDHLANMTRKIIEKEVYFYKSHFKEIHLSLGKQIPVDAHLKTNSIVLPSSVKVGNDFVRISGLMESLWAGKPRRLIKFVDSNNILVGAGVSGINPNHEGNPQHVFQENIKRKDSMGFVGYIKSSAARQKLTIVDGDYYSEFTQGPSLPLIIPTSLTIKTCDGYIDLLNQSEGRIEFAGWLVDSWADIKTSADKKVIILKKNDKRFIQFIPDAQRPDVVNAMNTPAFLNSGYHTFIDNHADYSSANLGYIRDHDIYECSNFKLK